MQVSYFRYNVDGRIGRASGSGDEMPWIPMPFVLSLTLANDFPEVEYIQ